MVRVGSSWKNWNTMPTLRPRQAASWVSVLPVMVSPATTILPVVARSMPVRRLMSVDLPLPDLPTTATKSPRASIRSMPLSAVNVPAGVS